MTTGRPIPPPERWQEQVDRRLTNIETTLHTLDERTATLPALVKAVLDLMDEHRHHFHTTSEPIRGEE